MMKEYVIDFEQLYESNMKCKCSVLWKPSVKSFYINDLKNIHKMHKKLSNGSWKNSKPRPIKIMYPKKRDGLSIPYRDRVYQRSINDNALYPEMTKHFIYDNWACQKGKGPDKARDRVKQYIHRYYINHGIGGYALLMDVKGYYPNMKHDVVKKVFSKYLPKDIYDMVCTILDDQYEGDVGYNPGSQMVQIAGIALLDALDHYVKEELHQRNYIRFMDDILVISNKETLECIKNLIISKLREFGCEINESKTKIVSLKKGFRFLGFDFRLTDTGKVIMIVDPEKVKHECKKLVRMVHKVNRGEMTKQKVDECYNSWKAHVSKGNHYKLLYRMDKFYEGLWEENRIGIFEKKDSYQTGKRD